MNDYLKELIATLKNKWQAVPYNIALAVYIGIPLIFMLLIVSCQPVSAAEPDCEVVKMSDNQDWEVCVYQFEDSPACFNMSEHGYDMQNIADLFGATVVHQQYSEDYGMWMASSLKAVIGDDGKGRGSNVFSFVYPSEAVIAPPLIEACLIGVATALPDAL